MLSNARGAPSRACVRVARGASRVRSPFACRPAARLVARAADRPCRLSATDRSADELRRQ
ncbi:hypothetical protein BURCENBC7_AP2442 [Burkholderia cenocepacia BC7]|nr:hypothetical protein BURCENK562V_C3868 [Burkholderia cenocepacia K56-2Valvano]ERI32427.1 hypothetical protein BURCENBC7_AP2442 [Burkholderia cenocepacia BC7]